MTGKYPARLGMTNITQYRAEHTAKMNYPASATELPLEETTIAEVLKSAGYATASIGKWHLGKPPYSPENQGFNVNIGGNNVGMPTSHFYPAWKEAHAVRMRPGPAFRSWRAKRESISPTA